MSGTSMDAIDVALVRFDEDSFSVAEYRQYPYADAIRSEARNLSGESPVAEVARLDAVLGGLFSAAVLAMLDQAGLKAADVAAVGSHGQTILHLPDTRPPRTLQIGDPNLIARRTGITTIADFRRMDMAAGGQGAPLAPAFHARYFHSPDADRVILNVGGIANITILPRDPAAAVTGFDTGPGNGLLDDWNQLHNDTPMDRNGEWAESGTAREDLLRNLLEDPYFTLPPPKSSGRDYFNLEWLGRHLEAYPDAVPEDVQATLLLLSARSIIGAVIREAPATTELYVCGGGVHNPRLLKELRQEQPALKIASTLELGLDPDAVEAVTFAWLAKQRLENRPGNLPAVTGAEREVLLGGVYTPSQ
jgi:anhydro-N-acetylmuramic acid kinase